MSTISSPTTAAQLAALPDDGKRYELVGGELRMMSPAGHEHGRIAMQIGTMLNQHVRANRLGYVYAAETGFLLSRSPDTVRAPDVAFVRQDRLTEFADYQGFLPLAPDLVAEVVSPNDSFTEVEEKALHWLSAGSAMVLVVDPGTRTVHVFRSASEVSVLSADDHCDAGDVVPGWKWPVSQLFE